MLMSKPIDIVKMIDDVTMLDDCEELVAYVHEPSGDVDETAYKVCSPLADFVSMYSFRDCVAIAVLNMPDIIVTGFIDTNNIVTFKIKRIKTSTGFHDGSFGVKYNTSNESVTLPLSLFKMITRIGNNEKFETNHINFERNLNGDIMPITSCLTISQEDYREIVERYESIQKGTYAQ